MNPLVTPATSRPVASPAASVERRVSTSCSVDTAFGPPSGITWIIARVRSSFRAAGTAALTWSMSATCSATESCRSVASSSSSPCGRSAVTTSGPL